MTPVNDAAMILTALLQQDKTDQSIRALKKGLGESRATMARAGFVAQFVPIEAH